MRSDGYIFNSNGVDLTWPMAKLQTFWDYIFSRENKVQTFFFRVHWLSERLFIYFISSNWGQIEN